MLSLGGRLGRQGHLARSATSWSAGLCMSRWGPQNSGQHGLGAALLSSKASCCTDSGKSAKLAGYEVAFPSKEDAKQMPKHVCELSNEALFLLAESGCHDACSERLARHIMATDDIEWLEAQKVVKQIRKVDQEVLWVTTMPYKIGITIGVSTGTLCIPLCFHLPSVEFFNKHFVTSPVPEPEDLETAWEVGAWAWNWMEPPLGTASFVLLAMQLTRAQMQNMGVKPYTQWVRNWRGDRLCKKFPKYQADFVKDFSATLQ